LQRPAMKITYALTAGAAAVLLCRVVWSRRPFGTVPLSLRERAGVRGSVTRYIPSPPAPLPEGEGSYEYACGVLFMTIFPPYFLVYDQTLLAVPLVMLWSSPQWRWGVALFAVTNVLTANLSFGLGFSLTGMVALAAMFTVAREARGVARMTRNIMTRNRIAGSQRLPEEPGIC